MNRGREERPKSKPDLSNARFYEWKSTTSQNWNLCKLKTWRRLCKFLYRVRSLSMIIIISFLAGAFSVYLFKCSSSSSSNDSIRKKKTKWRKTTEKQNKCPQMLLVDDDDKEEETATKESSTCSECIQIDYVCKSDLRLAGRMWPTLSTHVTYEYSSFRIIVFHWMVCAFVAYRRSCIACVNCWSARNAKAKKQPRALGLRWGLISSACRPYGPSLSVSSAKWK